jgi:hypothetical protein
MPSQSDSPDVNVPIWTLLNEDDAPVRGPDENSSGPLTDNSLCQLQPLVLPHPSQT